MQPEGRTFFQRAESKTMFVPLRLTPFEEYMLLDNQPAYPMNCFFMLKLQGQFDLAVFTSALHKTLEYHPFLTCLVTENNGHFHWQNTETMPVVIRQPLKAERPFPASKGIDLFHEPALKCTVCNENTDPAQTQLGGNTNIIFEFHHAACDAAGAARFIEDVLCGYMRQRCFADVQREPVKPDLLTHRGVFGGNWSYILQNLPKQLWGLTRAWMFLVNRVAPLVSKKPVDVPKLSAGYPAIVAHTLTVADTQTVRQKAEELGITINDLFLGLTFLAMKNWQRQYATEIKSGNLRIAVPINLRTPADVLMPASNIVSMVFLDRKPKTIQAAQSFYRGIHNEMQHIKRCNLGWAFIHGLTLYRRVFGSFRKMMKPNRCWTTATVTNLGRVFADLTLPVREGRIQMDDSLELAGVETSPPIRSLTAIGVSVLTYAGSMTINLHYDSALLTRSDAQVILDGIAKNCR